MVVPMPAAAPSTRSACPLPAWRNAWAISVTVNSFAAGAGAAVSIGGSTRACGGAFARMRPLGTASLRDGRLDRRDDRLCNRLSGWLHDHAAAAIDITREQFAGGDEPAHMNKVASVAISTTGIFFGKNGVFDTAAREMMRASPALRQDYRAGRLANFAR